MPVANGTDARRCPRAESPAGAGEGAVAPFVLIGTRDAIVAKIGEVERRWGIARFAVFRPGFEALPQILEAY
jgi:hypothetical protein